MRPMISQQGKPAADSPLKHVIAEYKHRAQTVTCVCGWHGSTATTGAAASEWNAHVAANRIRKP
jgi:hypothetical protein